MFELIRTLRIDAAAGTAVGEALVPADHPVFADHFPGAPLLPGSFLVELAAQVAGPLCEDVLVVRGGRARGALLGMVRRAVFPRPCFLPAAVQFTAQVRQVESARVTAVVGAVASEVTVLRAELVMAMIDMTPEWADVVEARHARVARWRAAGAG